MGRGAAPVVDKHNYSYFVIKSCFSSGVMEKCSFYSIYIIVRKVKKKNVTGPTERKVSYTIERKVVTRGHYEMQLEL